MPARAPQMSAQSDGAIVVAKPVFDPTRKATVLATLRHNIPDFIIAMWIGAIVGGALVQCLRHVGP
jgi:hypothetical protein